MEFLLFIFSFFGFSSIEILVLGREFVNIGCVVLGRVVRVVRRG